ncbi:hypothetical protein ACLBSY_25330 [Pseudomonas aeruginosa]|uniref:hypothetical protein n=1 Tax=Pseudomonas aeruginosa TaxID=287 RepID=UPI003968FCA6
MSIELNKESVEQADASSCQGTNCGTTTGDHSSECLAEAASGQGWELKPGDLCGRDCPIHKILAEQAGGGERAAFEAYRDRRNALLESEGHNPGSKWHVTNAHYPTWEASRAALARVEQQERTIASMNEAHAKLAGLYEAAQAQHSVPEGLALIPVRETEAMHDAVMALLYKGVARTDTQKLLDAYIAAAPGKEGV